LVLHADELAGAVLARRVDLDRLELAAELGTAVVDPALDVRRPADQRLAVPEADRVAVPLRDLGAEPRHAVRLVLELAADVDLRDQRLRGVAHVEHEIRGHDEVDPAAAALREAAHEAPGPAIRA